MLEFFVGLGTIAAFEIVVDCVYFGGLVSRVSLEEYEGGYEHLRPFSMQGWGR